MKKLISLFLALLLFVTPAALAQPSFTDIQPDDWFAADVQTAVSRGLMQGVTATTFAPNSSLTRAMTAVILHRMAGEPSAVWIDWFSDVTANQWYSTAISWATTRSILSGVGDGLFQPNAPITREQFAVLLHNYAGYLELDTTVPSLNLNTFTDHNQISSWAVESMTWAVYHGLITGTTPTTLSPDGLATRAQGATLLVRYQDFLTSTGFEPAPTPTPEPTPEPTPTPTPPPITEPPNGSAFELEVLRLTNIERANYGLHPLQWNNNLGTAARSFSQRMNDEGFFAHICPDGFGHQARIFEAIRDEFQTVLSMGENLAAGVLTPQDTINGWMNSPGHRAAILNPTHTHIGVGEFNRGPNPSGSITPNSYIVTQKFLGIPQ